MRFVRAARVLRGVLPILPLSLALASARAWSAPALPTGFVDETVAGGLDQPNSMAFLPDGRVLVTEQRTARVRLIAGGQLVQSAVLTVPDVNSTGYERGVQGIAVDPRWPERPYVYVFHNRTGNVLRLLRYRAEGVLTDPNSALLTFTDRYVVLDNLPDSNPNHNAGCLRFGPDGRLFVSLGEDEDYCAAQDTTSLKGQILRLDVSNLPDGPGGPTPRLFLVPWDNPYVTSSNLAARLVWAHGMRNPWRFQVDPATGRLYACDVGEEDFEEMNEIAGGDDLGWPHREGGLIMVRSYCPEPGGAGSRAYKGPILSLGRGTAMTAIVSGGAYRWPQNGTANWPRAYLGDVFYAEYYSGFLRRLERDAGGAWVPAAPAPGQPNATDWGTGFQSASDFLVGRDGSLWWLAQFDASFGGATGSLHRIRFTGSPVSVEPPPVAGTVPMSGAPNPFREGTEVWFRLGTAAHARLAVHDVSGRLVRVLWEGEAPVGDTRVPWDGRDARGRTVPPGTYFARLEKSGRTETLPLVRLR